METEQFSQEEFLLLSRELEKFHSIFYKIWEVGKPVFSDIVQTAAVGFNEEGKCVQFICNKSFWEGLSLKQKTFTLSHEMLHIILNHGIRLTDKSTRDIANIAQDLVINNMLVTKFGFNKNEIDPEEKFCWFSNIFKNNKDIKTDENFEYYFNLLKSDVNSNFSGTLVDDHNLFAGISSEEFIDSIQGNIPDNVKESVKEMIESHYEEYQSTSTQAGKTGGNIWKIVDTKPVPKKRKWETVISKWASKYIVNSYKEEEQWARINRRFINISSDLIIPSEMEIEENDTENKKIDVWFFQDTSGSCAHLAERFFRAAKTLPEDRFNIRMFCFDTSVYETSLKSGRLYGFGGTSFTCIENFIQKSLMSKEIDKFPDAIFVITDGYGDYVTPSNPENWHWFLSTGYAGCIQGNCKIYKLSDFE